MKTYLFIISITLIFINIYSCQPNYQLPDIQTGNINLQNIISNNQSSYQSTYQYIFFNKFYSTPQIAFAINNIQNTNLQLISFYITINNINITSTQLLLTNFQSWNLITINFIITLRNDLYLNTNQLDLTNSVINNNNNTFNLSLNKLINPYQSVTRIFINGFVNKQPLTKSSQLFVLNLTLDIISLSDKFITISLQGTTLNQIKSLWFSYLIFQPELAGFASYGGRIYKNNFQGIQSQNLHKIIYRSQYKIFGLNGIQLQQKSIALISSIGSDFVGTIYSNTLINSISIDYIVFGIQPNRMCLCGDTTLKYAYEDSCLSYCPNNTFANQYKDGSYSCLTCSSTLNMKINLNNTKCQCNDGYQFNIQETVCILQTKNQTFTSPQQKNILNSTNSSSNVQISNSCTSSSLNSYFDGTLCHCKPGFKNISSNCILISQISYQQKQFVPIPLLFLTNGTVDNFTCLNQNQININGYCQCQIGYQRVNSFCIQKKNGTCSINEYWNGQKCICYDGYIKSLNNLCQPQNNSISNCSENQINNGIGHCVCKSGYFYVNGKCVTDKPCPLNSFKSINNTCSCNSNFVNISGECSRCLEKQVWVINESKCVNFCGSNSIYNATISQCQCSATFAIYKQNTCQFCPPKKVILNNYCVSCPINQFYNSTLKQCVCEDEYYLEKNGICFPKCANNQYFDKVSMACKCQLTLGRYNNVCQICPLNYFVSSITQQCLACSRNQFYFEGKCICKDQYAPTIYGVCVPCGQQINTFLYKGKCATCPGQQIYDGNGCTCSVGTRSIGLKCVQSCKNDQILDSSGNCYSCPINEIVQNKNCVCKNSYQRIEGACQLICPLGSFIYKNRCAICPTNKIYNVQIKGCVCQNGFYLNVYNQCEKLKIEWTTCPIGKYIDLDFGCQDCSPFCSTCNNYSTCTTCMSSFLLINGKCEDFCGNGIISLNQQCDDQNTINFDGCSSLCKIEPNFHCSKTPSVCTSILPEIKCGNGIIETNQACDDFNLLNGDGCSSTCGIQRLFYCYGQPSICKYNSTSHICGNGYVQYSQKCDDNNFINGDGCNENCTVQSGYVCARQPSECYKNATIDLQLYGDIKYNINNIYISFQTGQKYQFNSQSDMNNFIKTSYSTAEIPSTYCLQRQYPDLDIFDCLLLYSSGIPNKAFKGEFSYKTPGDNRSIKLVLDIDPLSNQISKSKNLRRT